MGIVCTTDTRVEKDNIIDYIDYPSRIFPIGRLDKPSEGLILLTNDGDIVNKILRARNNHEKEYLVTVNRPVTEEFINEIDDVAAELQKNNFIISVVNKKKNDSKIDFIGQLDESVTGYTIFSWYHSKFRKVYWRREYSVPEKYFKKFSKINFMGREFKCPNNPQEYLSFAYGNWRTPLRTSVKDEYNTGKFKNKKIFKFLEFLKTTKRFFYNLKV